MFKLVFLEIIYKFSSFSALDMKVGNVVSIRANMIFTKLAL